jgi:hypothetical protein
VTRCVCEKIAQAVAQPVFVKAKCVAITVEKKSPKNVGYFFHLKKRDRAFALLLSEAGKL